MQINLNGKDLKERLNGNRLFLYKFRGFSTNSTKTSVLIFIVHSFFTTIFILIFIYIVFVVLTIFNIINKKETLSNIVNINNHIVNLENNYNKQISGISMDSLETFGFVNANHVTFVSKKDKLALSLLFQ